MLHSIVDMVFPEESERTLLTSRSMSFNRRGAKLSVGAQSRICLKYDFVEMLKALDKTNKENPNDVEYMTKGIIHAAKKVNANRRVLRKHNLFLDANTSCSSNPENRFNTIHTVAS